MALCPVCKAEISDDCEQCPCCGAQLAGQTLPESFIWLDDEDCDDVPFPELVVDDSPTSRSHSFSRRRAPRPRPDLDAWVEWIAPTVRSASADDGPPEAYARVDCPKHVDPGDSFWISVGLGPTPQGVGEQIDLPPWQDEPFRVSVELRLENIRFWGTKQPNPFVLEVGREHPDPSRRMRLYVPTSSHKRAGKIFVFYTLGSEPIGSAVRTIQIGAVEAEPESTATEADPCDKLKQPTAKTPPDLTIYIWNGEREGDLEWTYAPRDPHVKLDDIARKSRIGAAAQTFLRTMMSDLEGTSADLVKFKMRGHGREIAERLPEGFGLLLQRVTPDDRPPSILIVSDEPFIPWELASLSASSGRNEQWFGAIANIGRWYANNPDPPGGVAQPQRRQQCLPPSPPGEITVTQAAVVWSQYANKPLPKAEIEAQRLHAEFEAEIIPSTVREVSNYLERPPTDGLIHYAGHGRYSPDGMAGGLELSDTMYLSASVVRGMNLLGSPLVFLNACQIGAAFELLGGPGGMVNAFIDVGAAAVVAPLWSVGDKLANDVAQEFYEGAFPRDSKMEPVSPSEIIRRQRAQFNDRVEASREQQSTPDASENVASLMAYQFHGHPNLVVNCSIGKKGIEHA